jgi:RNA polymerase sigma-70 factor (ECF subfamily)
MIAEARPGTAQQGVVDLAERSWLPRHARGEAGAFDELLRTYRTLVLTLLVRYGIEAQHRDDLFQDIFLKVHQAAGSYRPSEPLRPWLVSIVLNTVRNFRRDRGRRQHFMTRLQTGAVETPATVVPLDPAPHAPGLDEQLEQQTTLAFLERRIAGLPERQREVLVLSTVKGLRLQEIASLLRLPENTVKTHLRRARLALAEDLAAHDGPAAVAGGESR